MKKLTCPTCLNESIWNETNPFRPFCSEQCRLIDLGDWLNEKHCIVEPAPSDHYH